jgi:hypothetical protein
MAAVGCQNPKSKNQNPKNKTKNQNPKRQKRS